MALTKVEAAKLTNDVLVRGVIDTVVKDSMVLAMLPFMDVNGTAITYNRENVMSTTAFYDPGDTWAEAAVTFTQLTAALKIMGGDADVDNFLQQTYANPNDQAAEQIRSKAKSTAHKYLTTFYEGDVAVDAKSFDGLTKMLNGTTQEITAGANGAQLTLDMVDQAIDLVKPGRPDAILVSKRTRRKLSSLRRASGSILETSVNAFGQHVTFYDGIPVITDDFIIDTQVQGTSGAVCSSLYCAKFGMEGLLGLQNGEIQVEDIGDLETKDATRWRVKWYASLALMSALGLSRVEGILP